MQVIYLIRAVLGGLAGCIAAVFAGCLMAVIAKLAGRLSLTVSVLITSVAMYFLSERISAPLHAGFGSGQIDGPGGIGAAALLVSSHAFAIVGCIAAIVIGANLWIKAPKHTASDSRAKIYGGPQWPFS